MFVFFFDYRKPRVVLEARSLCHSLLESQWPLGICVHLVKFSGMGWASGKLPLSLQTVAIEGLLVLGNFDYRTEHRCQLRSGGKTHLSPVVSVVKRVQNGATCAPLTSHQEPVS